MGSFEVEIMENRENRENSRVGGIKIRTFNICIIILSGILYIFLLSSTAGLSGKYHELIEHNDEYIACEEQASMLTKGSDYLTEQVRLYAQNMDVKYMEAYFEEANMTRRRDKALEELEKQDPAEEVREDLKSALQCSNDLMEREIYSMKLISTANNYDDSILPEEVRNMPLKAADASLQPQEMIEKARELVFNEGYQDAKALIYSYLSHFVEDVSGITKEKQERSEAVLSKSIFYQRIFVSILFVLNVLTYVVITALIIRPLSIHIKRIKDNAMLEIVGSYEFKYLALTYNDIYELNDANKKMLMHKAEHDALTGLLNRSTFDSLKVFLKDTEMPLALTVIDVDKFKEVNDHYGHQMGDDVLKKVANVLKSSFRSNDYVIRLGGDEFVVLMTEISKNQKNVIENKFMQIGNMLSEQSDGLPKVSLSVGVAFSEKGFDEGLFEKADQALYEAKNAGRNQTRFFR